VDGGYFDDGILLTPYNQQQAAGNPEWLLNNETKTVSVRSFPFFSFHPNKRPLFIFENISRKMNIE